MTTIAYDGKMLSSDSGGYTTYQCSGETKKIFKKNGSYFAGTGSYPNLVRFIETGDGLGENDLVLEVSLKTGKAQEHCKDGSYPSVPPVALGSGANFAMGAMLAGKSAKEAVVIAIKLDAYSSGRVKTKMVLK